ncbi:unnamed protein product, partial [Rotaria magnacalcarata]
KRDNNKTASVFRSIKTFINEGDEYTFRRGGASAEVLDDDPAAAAAEAEAVLVSLFSFVGELVFDEISSTRTMFYSIEYRFSFECSQCGKPYSNQDHVNRHYRIAHQQENTTSKTFNCMMDNCKKIFANKQNLDRHIRIAHKKIKLKPVK